MPWLPLAAAQLHQQISSRPQGHGQTARLRYSESHGLLHLRICNEVRQATASNPLPSPLTTIPPMGALNSGCEPRLATRTVPGADPASCTSFFHGETRHYRAPNLLSQPVPDSTWTACVTHAAATGYPGQGLLASQPRLPCSHFSGHALGPDLNYGYVDT